MNNKHDDQEQNKVSETQVAYDEIVARVKALCEELPADDAAELCLSLAHTCLRSVVQNVVEAVLDESEEEEFGVAMVALGESIGEVVEAAYYDATEENEALGPLVVNVTIAPVAPGDPVLDEYTAPKGTVFN
jgi:hypothetical protein